MTASVLLSRQDFLANLRKAIRENRGYAAGKLGASELHRLSYNIFASEEPKLLPVLKPSLIYHSWKQAGLFPPDPKFYLRYNEFYAEQTRGLDCIGIFPDLAAHTARVAGFYRLDAPLIDYLDQEPDRSTPSREANCYLPDFEGKKILLVSSYANILCERANRQMFEAVWAKTGKQWFYPQSVEPLEFPYGYSAETALRYADSLALYEEITAAMSRIDFDVALIAAGGIAIPLAMHAKRMGKVAISLGGHLQVLFGVAGKRWRAWPEWHERYFNSSWIDLGIRYRPPEPGIADDGAYW